MHAPKPPSGQGLVRCNIRNPAGYARPEYCMALAQRCLPNMVWLLVLMLCHWTNVQPGIACIPRSGCFTMHSMHVPAAAASQLQSLAGL